MTTKNTIREPKQARSIEKKKKIIEAGIKLICENGYRNTTTADIAKAANVSTGIVYSYFKDKKDILMAGLDTLFDQMEEPLFQVFHQYTTKESLMDNMSSLMDQFVAFHQQLSLPHQELASIASFDPDVADWMRSFEISLVDQLVDACSTAGINPPHLRERIHIAYNIIEDYCHEVVFYPNERYDYAAVKEETLRCIHALLLDA